MRITKVGDIHEVSFEYSGGQNYEQWILLMSDEHFDSIDCDRALLKKHHEQAKDRGAPIFKFGDCLDVMGCKHDPRSDMSMIRPEYKDKPGYLSLVLEDAIKFYKDYPVAFISDGNHEENILKRHEIDMTGAMAKEIGAARGHYSGFLRFKFKAESGGGTRTFDMYYDHGSGGNSPVTKGVISTNRRGAAYDADILVSGHNHNRWMMEMMREGVTQSGEIKARPQLHLNMGTYNRKPAKRSRFESGFPSPNLGGIWLRFGIDGKQAEMSVKAIYA